MSTLTDTQELLPTGTWVEDTIHSHVGFEIGYATGTFRGSFSPFVARLTVESDGGASLVGEARADRGALRRVDLAGELLLTPSGVTRLLDGLEQAGFVCKGTCESDARVTYAVLTDAGRAKLEQASCSHVAAVSQLFGERFDDDELESLASLLGRLPGADGDPEACTAGGGQDSGE